MGGRRRLRTGRQIQGWKTVVALGMVVASSIRATFPSTNSRRRFAHRVRSIADVRPTLPALKCPARAGARCGDDYTAIASQRRRRYVRYKMGGCERIAIWQNPGNRRRGSLAISSSHTIASASRAIDSGFWNEAASSGFFRSPAYYQTTWSLVLRRSLWQCSQRSTTRLRQGRSASVRLEERVNERTASGARDCTIPWQSFRAG